MAQTPHPQVWNHTNFIKTWGAFQETCHHRQCVIHWQVQWHSWFWLAMKFIDLWPLALGRPRPNSNHFIYSSCCTSVPTAKVDENPPRGSWDIYRVYTVIRLRGRTREADQIRLLGFTDPRLHSDHVHGADPATGADRKRALCLHYEISRASYCVATPGGGGVLT